MVHPRVPGVLMGVLVLSFPALAQQGDATTELREASTTVPSDVRHAGLGADDWDGIRAAYEAGRHAARSIEGDSYQVRNPGQGWSTRFDGRGSTTVPDVGGWTWGLELLSYGFQDE